MFCPTEQLWVQSNLQGMRVSLKDNNSFGWEKFKIFTNKLYLIEFKPVGTKSSFPVSPRKIVIHAVVTEPQSNW